MIESGPKASVDDAMNRRLVIIGAGIAGLTAGIYTAKSGYAVTALEVESGPGGLCTSWRRGGHRFDGSVAGLAGKSPEVGRLGERPRRASLARTVRRPAPTTT
jgi:phytoene dehydrogenase-like protein